MGCKWELRVFDFLSLSRATFTLLDNRGMSQRPGNGEPRKAQVERGTFIKAEDERKGFEKAWWALDRTPEGHGARVICSGVPRMRTGDPTEKAVPI